MSKLRILEITAFSAGICGVWTRVLAESSLLSRKGNEVHVFSSNIFRGDGEKRLASEEEVINGVKVKRFPTKGSFGANTFFWDYKKEALDIKPDIIIAHAYRQYYSTLALKVAKKLKIPCILVTHAPFLEKNLRNKKANTLVWVYDTFIGRRILNKYTKIFSITKWEIPYLKKLGVKEDKIIYVPNGIPEEFFKLEIPKTKPSKTKKILFLGRVAHIKDIETLVKAFNLALEKDKNLVLNLVGPIEKDYGDKVKELINRLNLSDKVIFYPAVYDLNEKIKIIDNSDIFVLSSKREGMPQALIEAMSREKIVISSKTDGGKEMIEDEKNGYLFEIGNEKELSEKILLALENNDKNSLIRKEAKDSVRQFSWESIIKSIEEEIEKATNNR